MRGGGFFSRCKPRPQIRTTAFLYRKVGRVIFSLFNSKNFIRTSAFLYKFWFEQLSFEQLTTTRRCMGEVTPNLFLSISWIVLCRLVVVGFRLFQIKPAPVSTLEWWIVQNEWLIEWTGKKSSPDLIFAKLTEWTWFAGIKVTRCTYTSYFMSDDEDFIPLYGVKDELDEILSSWDIQRTTNNY